MFDTNGCGKCRFNIYSNTQPVRTLKQSFTIIVSIFIFCCTFISLAQAIDLNNKEVSKDKFIVFILIGHSNMIGRNNDCDTETHPHAWNYKIDDGTDAWVPAKGPLFYDGQGKKERGTYIGCGPGMHLLKRLVQEFPDHHFGVIEFAWSGGRVKHFQKEGKFYNKLVPHLIDIKSEVTFGGILAMLGRMERYEPKGFAESVAQMVGDLREAVNSHQLPYFQQRERGYDSAAKKIRWEQERVAKVVPYSAVVKTDGPDLYTGHYSGIAEKRWANEVVDILLAKQWLPIQSGN